MKKKKLPENFKPLFWSQNFVKLDLNLDRKSIVINTLNYGDLSHWKWIRDFYGKEEIKKIISNTSVTELRKSVRPLVKIAFSISRFNCKTRGKNPNHSLVSYKKHA